MKVVTFGEVMLRLATPGFLRLNQTPALEMTFGGGEANVAVSLALFGEEASFVTRLPKNDVAEACIQKIRGLGVDTSKILRGDEILKGADWFHFTGITPALSDAAAQASLDGAKAAKRLGLTVSCDLNFRKKLWTSEKAGKVMFGLMEFVDICIANEEDAEKVFGIKAGATEVTKGEVDHALYVDVAERLTKMFNFKGVAITLRESHSASRNGWSALYYTGGKGHFSRHYDVQIVDRVGGGDSFAAGLVYALGKKKSPQEAIEFAVAASCLKHTISGDFNLVRLSEVEALLAGDGSGRVQR
jgi:2-dehydro-3-deoxygluconokinase